MRLENNTNEDASEFTIKSKLNSSYAHLSSTEQRIAAFVMEFPTKVIYSSVTQVADELEVAQSTITRFCKSIGLRGYQELKIKLARDMDGGIRPDTNEGKMNLPQRLAHISIGNLQETLKVLDLEELQKSVIKIMQARKIVIFGLGESGALAVLLKMKLLGMGFMADAHIDVHLQLISAAHLNTDDVAIGISQIGSTMDVVDALKKARSSGAHTICITGHGRSPITEVADTRLVCLSKGVSIFENDLKSKVSILYIIELITISLTLYLSESSSGADAWKTTESILNKLY
ncbi:HTH-type transcriptional regulator HexR [Paenibacillus allorhizoplanae]|uniref:HTH-type transcriptional regulator HexR n=1 Tax=Paenibacillus allorhizoplanae TaxID=2905648 RepID=A0ABN8GYG6_9BACL|nr:MurR/RpiR family transcriptional regulator [Paenibacillus allorhizoplanae]CAH1217649.1 HTH-type transcriptional regulator HexR [Paenibacillus allorhizoplanae]